MASEVEVDLLLKPTSDKTSFNKIKDEARRAGKDSADSFEESFKSGAATIAKTAAVAVTAAAAAIGFALKKAVSEATKQEDAVNRLNFALQSTGQFSQQASNDLQAFASQLQETTRFGDDAVLSAAALIQQLAALDSKGLKRATQASADFAAFLGGDLESAASLVAKAIEGNVGVLGRYGIKVQQGATQAETLNNVLTALESRFKGSAANQVNTFSGAMDQLANAFGDVFEEVGNVIIQNPVIISLIKDTKAAFKAAGDQIKEYGKTFNIVTEVIEPLFRFNNAVIKYVVAPLELAGNVGKFIFLKINEGITAAVAVLGQAGGKIAEFLGKFGVDNEFTQGLTKFGEVSTQVFTSVANDANESYKSMFDFPFAQALFAKNEELRLSLEARNQDLKNKNQVFKDDLGEAAFGMTDIFKGVVSGFTSTTSETFQETTNRLKKFAKDTGVAIRNGVGVSAANAFSAYGKALAEGEDASKAFEKAFIQSIGQVAVQQGTAFILEGTAMLFRPGFQGIGAGMIAAGAALATLGGVASAVGSKGRQSVGGGGIGASADTQVTSFPETLSQPEEIAQRSDAGPRVQLVVQGDIFDSEETGNRLIDILNANFENKGNSFNNARFA